MLSLGWEADMRRRKFLRVLGSGGIAWPLVARAQQPGRLRGIGMLVAGTADDPEHQARVAAFPQSLERVGWADGPNARFDIRWASTSADALRKHAAELA